jgi:glycosyltransferase involved in cell wall biosynthesis
MGRDALGVDPMGDCGFAGCRRLHRWRWNVQQALISRQGADRIQPASPRSTQGDPPLLHSVRAADGAAGSPIRVLTFLHSFEPGGVERIALRLIRRWRALGIDAPLFMGRSDGGMRHNVGTGLGFVTRNAPGGFAARWEMPWMIWALPRIVREVQPDIVFCAGNTYAIVAVCLKIALGRKCPLILAKISNDLDRRDRPWWQRSSYHIWLRIKSRFMDHIVSMDDSMVEEICTRLAVAPNRVTTIPDPALSSALIEKLRTAPSLAPDAVAGRRFVAIGRLAPQKNVALMLRAFQRGARLDDHLTVIGDGPERPKLELLARRLGIGDRVEFRGYVADPAAILHQFQILLLSSNYEGVPAVILEALAARLAIVATDCSRSMAALLEQGKLGDLVPVRDEAIFAAAIARARPGHQDAALCLALAERFTLERASELYIDTMIRLHRSRAARQSRAVLRLATSQPQAVTGR